MMYVYVTCRPDISYAITAMSNSLSTPSALHYLYLKHVACYLRATIHWGIRYKRSKLRDDLPPSKFYSIVPAENATNDLPEFPVDINQAELLCFVDAAYAKDLRKHRSTTGFSFTYCGGAIFYRYKTQ